MYAWAQSKLSARTSPLGFPGEELEAHHEGVPGAVSVGPNLGDLPELVQPAHEGPRVEIPVAIVRAGPHLAEKDEKPGSLRPRRGGKKTRIDLLFENKNKIQTLGILIHGLLLDQYCLPVGPRWAPNLVAVLISFLPTKKRLKKTFASSTGRTPVGFSDSHTWINFGWLPW